MRERMTQIRETDPVLYASGLPTLDSGLGGGIAPGEVCVIAASTSHGKTLFGMQWALELSRAGHPILMVSEEMTPDNLADRGIHNATQTDKSEWRARWQQVYDDIIAWEAEHPGTFLLPEVPVHSADRAADAIGQAVRDYGIKLAVVDYIQLLDGVGTSRYEQVSYASRMLKQCAVEHNIAIIALAQLNKTVDTIAKGIPEMFHIADSSQIAKDADCVLMLQWPYMTDHGYTPANEYRIYIKKNRNRGIRGDTVLEMRIKPLRQQIVEKELREHSNYRPEFDDYNREPAKHF
jgi:replicative DNA helicase